jgi:para-aminobenzoate synthetase component 1
MLDTAPVVVRSGRTTIIAAEPVEVVAAWGDDALDALDRLTPGWWAGVLSYDLGRSIERVVPRHGEVERGVPDVLLARYDARLVVAGGQARFEGRRAATRRLERVLARAPAPTAPVPLGAATSSLDRDEYEAGVASIIELIEVGECYQVNLTRRLTWDHAADGLALHHALAKRNPAPHAGLFALPRPDAGPLVVVSASPERFLSWRGRDVETCPIKGTARRAEPLMASTKDRAENVMIVDLARNDLGRVCEFGSVHVPALCAVEHHPGLHHLVSTVRGRLRADVGVRELCHRCPEAPRAPSHRRPGARAPRRLLRRGGLARHRAR